MILLFFFAAFHTAHAATPAGDGQCPYGYTSIGPGNCCHNNYLTSSNGQLVCGTYNGPSVDPGMRPCDNGSCAPDYTCLEDVCCHNNYIQTYAAYNRTCGSKNNWQEYSMENNLGHCLGGCGYGFTCLENGNCCHNNYIYNLNGRVVCGKYIGPSVDPNMKPCDNGMCATDYTCLKDGYCCHQTYIRTFSADNITCGSVMTWAEVPEETRSEPCRGGCTYGTTCLNTGNCCHNNYITSSNGKQVCGTYNGPSVDPAMRPCVGGLCARDYTCLKDDICCHNNYIQTFSANNITCGSKNYWKEQYNEYQMGTCDNGMCPLGYNCVDNNICCHNSYIVYDDFGYPTCKNRWL